MVNILAKNKLFCTGCAACYNICPVNAISLKEDMYGFLQAHINNKICIKCGQCEDICPVLFQKNIQETNSPQCFAVMADDDVRFKSSSGGAFFSIAKKIIDEGGVVIGATLDTDFVVRHIAVETIEDLSKLQKSKYVQSQLGAIYKDIECVLQTGRTVLFSGCPCEVAGIQSYFGIDTQSLITVDILCHGVPSLQMLKESLDSTISLESVKTVDFRDKDYGWESLGMTLTLKDNSKQRLTYDESRYEQGFHSNISLRDSCYDCKFCDFPRCGDITIGDFWNIAEYDSQLDDRKGTSAVLINSEKGMRLFELLKSTYKVCKIVPIKYLQKNRLTPNINIKSERKYFLDLYPKHDFNTSVLYAQQKKFDIGLVGNWSYPNYGSELTYYALYSVLKQMGLSVLLLSWPEESHWKPYSKPQLFDTNPYQDYEIAPLVRSRRDLKQFSDKCNTFVLGSDQLLNNNLYHWFDKFMQLDWVRSNKRKVAYATSFGCDYIWGTDEDRAELAFFLQKFDYFSVREKSGIKLAKEYYGVNAEWVVDPIFLQERSFYENLAQQALSQIPDKKYLFSYILDISKDKENVLLEYANHLNLTIYAALDADQEHNGGTSEWGLKTIYNLSVEAWLAYISNCEFMVTDSFHGMCFAILFHKPFIAISNSRRGKTRFESILNELGLEKRLVNSAQELLERLQAEDSLIDYESVDSSIQKLAQKSAIWLQHAISDELPVKIFSTFDFISDLDSANRNIFNQFWDTDQKQWEQLEDHRNRLDAVDTLQNNLTVTDEMQWEQLKDHRKRLDGLDILQSEYDAKSRKQWRLLEDYCEQLDNVTEIQQESITIIQEQLAKSIEYEIQIKELEQAFQEQLRDINLEIKLLQDGFLEIGKKVFQIERSYSYKIGKIITFFPRKIWSFIKKNTQTPS